MNQLSFRRIFSTISKALKASYSGSLSAPSRDLLWISAVILPKLSNESTKLFKVELIGLNLSEGQ